MRSLPRVVSQIPNDLRAFLDRVREYLSDGGDERFVTLRELKRGGIVGTTPGGTITEPIPDGVETPNLPRGFTATGAFATVILEWATPDYLGHAYTEVWAASVDDFTLKELVGSTDGNIFSHSLGTGATRYYWIRFVNKLGTAGPFNATAGTVGQTSQDPDYLIEVLSDEYGGTGPAPFFQVDTPTVINGVTVPAGTYIKQAWIADATISRAKIQNLAVDDAKIASMAVDKLTAGTLQVGSYIQSQSYSAGVSGWRINADGAAEFAQAVIRGSIFGGSATAYGTGTGLFSGLDSAVYKFRVGTPGGNQIAWDGSALSVTGTLLGGAATAYATGTGLFSGDVSGTYSWRVGNPTGARIQWTGSALEVYNAANVLTIASGDINYSVITGTKPPPDATRNVVFRQSSTPTGAQVNDVWFNTGDNSTYYFNGSGWVKAGDVTANNTAAAVLGQGSLATVSGFSSTNATTYIADLAFRTSLLQTNAISQFFTVTLGSTFTVATNVENQRVVTLEWTIPSDPGLPSGTTYYAYVSYNTDLYNESTNPRRYGLVFRTQRLTGATSPAILNYNDAIFYINGQSGFFTRTYVDHIVNYSIAGEVVPGQSYRSYIDIGARSGDANLSLYSASIVVFLLKR